MLRREDGQSRGEMANVLPAAGVGLIEEPAVDQNTHSVYTVNGRIIRPRVRSGIG